MREIKFRIWDSEYQGMSEPITIPELILQEAPLLAEHILMQYTGLKDKNGKEIYEGDIVKIEDSAYGGIETVEYENGGFYPFCISGSECNDSPGDAEVIGNVYENPELVNAPA